MIMQDIGNFVLMLDHLFHILAMTCGMVIGWGLVYGVMINVGTPFGGNVSSRKSIAIAWVVFFMLSTIVEVIRTMLI